MLLLGQQAAQSEETTLKAVSCFPQGMYYSQRFETFIERINERSDTLKINYLGGAPKVLPTFEVGKNLKDGVVDISLCSAGFYQNIVPEIDAIKLAEMPIAELRKNGAVDYLDMIHNEKMNAKYLGLVNNYSNFHIYLVKPVAKPDFTGMKIRVSPIYRALVEDLGGTAVASAPADIYTMLERGNVDGYGWPTQGIFDFSWQDVTNYRIDPGFYRTEMNFLINLDAWNSLTEEQQKLIQDTIIEIEAEDVKEAKIAEQEKKRQAEAGIEVIEFTGEDRETYLNAAKEAGWDLVIENSPEHGPKLRELFTKD